LGKGHCNEAVSKGRYAMVALADIALQPADALVNWRLSRRVSPFSLPYREQLSVKNCVRDRAGGIGAWPGARAIV